MEERKKFKENNIVTFSKILGVCIIFLGLFTSIAILILSIFIDIKIEYSLLFLFGSILLVIPIQIIDMCFGLRDKYSLDFLDKIRQDLYRAVTLEELNEVYKNIHEYAVEDGKIILSFPLQINEVLKECNSKIDILKKQ
jgi:hypothetical protein